MEHRMKADATSLMESDKKATWRGSKRRGYVEGKVLSLGLGYKEEILEANESRMTWTWYLTSEAWQFYSWTNARELQTKG